MEGDVAGTRALDLRHTGWLERAECAPRLLTRRLEAILRNPVVSTRGHVQEAPTGIEHRAVRLTPRVHEARAGAQAAVRLDRKDLRARLGKEAGRERRAALIQRHVHGMARAAHAILQRQLATFG